MPESTLVRYLDMEGRTPFQRWFERLGPIEMAKVTMGLDRLAAGNLSNAKSVGAGVVELRIHYGPGYRVYFGRDGERIIVLLAGGTKKRQELDITMARQAWRDYWSRRDAGAQTSEDSWP
jgi:putative addiction module killer protein